MTQVSVSPPKKELYYSGSPYLGCDPEFFFEKEGGVIGAEKVIASELRSGSSKLVLDGVQVELNPQPYTCRESLAGEIAGAFRNLSYHLASMKGVKANFATCIDLSKEELDSLSDRAKVLGCAPSLNREDMEGKKSVITIDGATALRRSAGGHIHLGLNGSTWTPATKARLVDILDIILGNSCVLIDRDPNAASRREVYGRAGEYRIPKHGLEYRTLSNFWLRSYPLFSFVMAAARQAVQIMHHSLLPGIMSSNVDSYRWNPETTLLDLMGGEEGLKLVRQAINTNDFDLAFANWQKFKPFILDHVAPGSSGFSPSMVDNFEVFVQTIKQKGIEAWFPDDPLSHWVNLRIGYNGWERFIAAKPLRPFSSKG